jgi:hypothetical protein
MSELVPQAIHDLLAFYTEFHSDARFGDFDIATLQQAVESTDEPAQLVIAAEEAAAQAREQFRIVEAELLAKAGRAVAFLKLHVEGEPAQMEQIESIGSALIAHRRKVKSSTEPTLATGEPRQRRSRKSKNDIEASPGIESNPTSAVEVLDDSLILTDDMLTDARAS